jgi:3-oxoacyl-[acyl-carrier-protein] synthase II
MSRRRVVVTGLGCVCPVGNTVQDAWANLLAGRSGIDRITKFDASNFACQIAGEVRGFDLGAYISAKDARTMDSFIHFGIAAAVQAVPTPACPRARRWTKSWPRALPASSARALAACR